MQLLASPPPSSRFPNNTYHHRRLSYRLSILVQAHVPKAVPTLSGTSIRGKPWVCIGVCVCVCVSMFVSL